MSDKAFFEWHPFAFDPECDGMTLAAWNAATAAKDAEIAALKEEEVCIRASSLYSADLCTQALDTVREQEAQIAALRQDAERFAAIANLDHVVINKWLVQAMTKESYHSEYFKAPPGGMPVVLHPSKLEALRSAIDATTAQATQPKEV